MEVNEVKPINSVKITPEDQTQSTRRSVKELSANKVGAIKLDPVQIELNIPKERSVNDRKQANEAIKALNLVAAATEDIDKMVTSLAGITEQAMQPNLANSRRDILEKEAQDLVKAIAEKADVEVSPGVKPLKGDPIQVNLEKELGKFLQVILPDTTPEGLGIKELKLSPAERIIQIRQTISEAKSRMEEVRSKVIESKNEVAKKITEAEIAAENKLASESSVRDLDKALKLTSAITSLVNQSPKDALSATGLGNASLRLLTNES